jgi:hypothetical protein
MGDLVFIADAPGLEPKSAPPTSRFQLAKAGKFKHRRYGRFAVDGGTFDSFVDHFQKAGRLPVDFEHAPDKGGSSEAAGWITGLEHDGKALSATVEWTPKGAEAIRDRRFLFISPTWKMKGEDDEGKQHGPRLIGAGLTNRPFFQGMGPVVSFSEEFNKQVEDPAELAVEDTEPAEPQEAPAETYDDPEGYYDGETFIGAKLTSQARADLPASDFVFPDERRYPIHDESHARNALARSSGKPEEAAVRAAVYKRYPDLKPDEDDESDTHDATCKSCSKSMGKAKKQCPHCGVMAYEEPPEEPSEPPHSDSREVPDSRAGMSFTDDLARVFDLSSEATEDEILTAARETREQAKSNPSVTMTGLVGDIARVFGADPDDPDAVLTAAQEAMEKADRGENSGEQLRSLVFSSAFDKAVDEGRATPAMREQFQAYFDRDEQGALNMIKALRPVVATRPRGAGSGIATAPEGVDQDAYELDHEIRAYMAQHDCDYVQAFDAVVSGQGGR